MPEYGDEGGVDGLNRRLNAARQLADADRSPDGSLKYRFIGLFDNDNAGRQAVSNACDFDRRLPALRRSVSSKSRDARSHRGLTTGSFSNGLRRITQLSKASIVKSRTYCRKGLLSAFEDECPNGVFDDFERGGFKHREFTKDGKRELQQIRYETCET